MAKRMSIIYGAAFVLIGVLGFAPNPLVGTGAFFATNTPHDITHLLIGIVMLWSGSHSEHASYVSLLSFGAVYALLAVMGYSGIGAEGHMNLLGLVPINGNDNGLHALLAAALITTGLATRRRIHAVHAHRAGTAFGV